MNENNLNIEEVRENCNLAIDYLQDALSHFAKFITDDFNTRVGNANNKLKDKYSRKVNSDFLDKISSVIKFGLNVFAIQVLKIDHELLDFDMFKTKKKTDASIKFDYNSPYLARIRVINNVCSTLENVKSVINSDDSQALLFYRWVVRVAYQNQPFWQDFFTVIEKMNVDVTYSIDDRRKGFMSIDGYSLHHEFEKGLFDTLNNKKLAKNGINR